MEVLTRIVREAAKDIPSINAGGCGLFALNMAKQLAPLRPEIYNISGIYPRHARELSKEGRLINNTCHHIFIKVKGVFLDSTGASVDIKQVKKVYYGDTVTRVKLKDVEKAVNQEAIWNPMFDREKYGKVLEEQIKLAVSKNLCPLLKDKFITKKK